MKSTSRLERSIRLIFPRDDLRPMRLAHPNDLLLSVSKRCGVEYIGVYGLRHAYASMLFASGASMKEVPMKLSHSKIETTINLYTHVTKERKVEVVKNFIDFLAK
ncbi:tyrosine-type recombinase/integrase [Planococcus sp. CP5-4_UN]|uniref:tyrosine-type recombinase/integrase n=1 Tax=Planococcus sp. CP5-4_UN TaxID=2850852 RepID=UPI00349F2490